MLHSRAPVEAGADEAVAWSREIAPGNRANGAYGVGSRDVECGYVEVRTIEQVREAHLDADEDALAQREGRICPERFQR
jgi:hypothetical protein